MKKLFLGIGLALFSSLVTFNNIENGSINLRATEDFTIYKNSDLGLANYGDTYEYVNPEANKHVTGADLSSKSELQLSFKFGVSGQNSYIAVGGYGVYVSVGSTIRLLYLGYDSSTGKDVRQYEKTNLILKDENGNALTSVMPNNKIFDDYVDATLKVDQTGEYASIGFSCIYKNIAYYLYENSTKLDTVTYTHKSYYKDNKFRFSNADNDNKLVLCFKSQEEDVEDTFTNNGQFTYGGTHSKLLSKQECKKENVPEGYEGSVFKTSGDTNAQFNFDFSNSNIKLNDNLKITFKLYAKATASGNYPEIRSLKQPNVWAFNGTDDFKGGGGYSLKSVVNQWYTFELTKDIFINGTTWQNAFSASKDSSILGNITLFFRCGSASDILYIDSVNVSYIGNEFTNNGQFSYSVTAGKGTLLNGSELEKEGLGEGYDGEVLKISGGQTVTATFDYNGSNIPLNLVDNLIFRVYAVGTVSGSYPAFRLKATNWKNRGLNDWPYQCKEGTFKEAGGWSLTSVMQTWHEFKVDATTLDSNGLKNLESETKPGYLGAFEIMYRNKSESNDALYFDSVTLNLKENDHTGPLISYNGKESLRIPAKAKVEFDVSAFDAQDNLSTAVTTHWEPEQKFDEEGRILNKGNFKVTFSSKDYYQNETSKSINIEVGEEDLEAPIISIPFSTLKFKTGTKFEFDPYKYVTDAYDFEVSASYSSTALDANNCLLAGEYTLTITAIDSSGNKSSKVINIIVSDDYVDSGDIKDEDKIDQDFKAVEVYCQTYLKKGSVPTSDGTNTGACLSDYAAAKEAFNSLSEDQKNIFTNSSEYADMYARLQAWAIANGETFNGSSFNSNSFNMMNANSINQLQIALITLIAISSFVCFFFAIKRRKSK